MKKKQQITPIVALLILIILAGVGYFGYKNLYPRQSTTQLTMDTTKWKTYQFTDFSIKLPTEFYNTNSSQSTIQFLNYKLPTIGSDFDPQKDKGKLKVEIYVTDGSSLNDYVNQEKQKVIELHGANIDTSDKMIVVDGQTARQFSSWVAVKHPSKNKIISINFLLDFFNYKDLSSQILSTFKFTNPVAEKTQSDLVGIWQANGSMAAGWSDRYHFYTDGNYHFYPNQMVKSDLIEKTGTWQIKNNQLILDGKTLTLEFLGKSTGDFYPSISIAGKQYWKFSSDPTNYGGEKFPQE